MKKITSPSLSGHGRHLGVGSMSRDRKSLSLQVIDRGLPARERVGVNSEGLWHPGRARVKSLAMESDAHEGEYVGVLVQVQEVEFHLGEKL